MKVKHPLTVVPWFSKDEFVKVYDDMQADDIRLWKQARDTILVWQARVDELPVCVDVTLPLLDAKISNEDHTVPDSGKAVFMAAAIQRFVTSVLKMPQTKNCSRLSMVTLASEIGLPSYFVHLRNEIVHGSGGWGGGDTVKCAVDSCFSWIMSFYWTPEVEKIKTPGTIAPRFDNEHWLTFMTCLNKFGERLLLELNKQRTSRIYHEAAEDLLKYMVEVYEARPEETTEEIVSHLLLYDSLPGSYKLKHGNKKCGCVLEPNIIEGVNPAIDWLVSAEETVEPIISCLIKKGIDNSLLAVEWIYVIAGSLLHPDNVWSPNSLCHSHLLYFEKKVTVDWKNVMMELLEAETAWAADIATQLVDATEISLTNSQKEKLKELLTIMKSSSFKRKKKSEMTPEDNVIHTVDDVIKEAQTNSSAFGDSLEDLRNSVFIRERGRIGDTPLGVLPHQKDNPRLFWELVLNYPLPQSSIMEQPLRAPDQPSSPRADIENDLF